MDELHKELRALEARHPITGFTVRDLWPERGTFDEIPPDEHWRRVARLHAEHEIRCPQVPRLERRRLNAMRAKHQPLELFGPLDDVG